MSVTEILRKEGNSEEEIEIRLSDIIRFLRSGRTKLILGALIGLAIGALYAFSRPNQYSVQVTVMPEIQSKTSGLGGLGSLAGLAGIDISSAMNGSVDAIRPDIYPDVLKSVPFALQLLRQPVYSQLLRKETSLQNFLEEKNRQSLLGGLMNVEDDDVPMPDPTNKSKTLQITKKQETYIKQVHEAVAASFDKKSGIITVTATLSDPVVTATVARLSLDYLTNYIASYRTEKTRNQVRFLTRQVAEAKSRYQRAEYTLSKYRDENRNTYLYTAKIEEQRLQADFLLTQNVFSELSKQLEQAKIKVAEELPVFKILEPARIPLKKSGPKRLMLMAGFMILGALIDLTTVVVKRFLR